MSANTISSAAVVITPQQLLEHWQGHRKLTRRTIEAYPEDKIWTFSVAGMRSFGELIQELLRMAAPSIKGLVEKRWPSLEEVSEGYLKAKTKEELLAVWDKSTEELNTFWPQIPAEDFQKQNKFWDQYEGQNYWSILYLIDNEIHHRGQAFVYLRSLGIEPPAFWDR